MTAKKTEIAILFQKLVDGTATPTEIGRYYQLVEEPAYEVEIIRLMSTGLNSSNLAEETDQQRLNLVYGAIHEKISKDAHSKPSIYTRIWPRIISAAAAILLIAVGVNLFYSRDKKTDQVLAVQDINPGKKGATLTLANGQKIRLSDAANGEIAKEAGIRVTKTADGQLVYEIVNSEGNPDMVNTLSTEIGETYILTLPDKSKVWLNAASSLSYSAKLNENGVRRVTLDGEAFFQIAKDKAHPFVVHTAKQEVEVLGTAFNINSYQDEGVVATTLIEGSVKVKNGKGQQVIVPGEQVVNDGQDLRVAKVNLDNVVDWKEGEFNLDGMPFRAAMRKIARWYNVEVIYDESVPENIVSGGWISRDVKLSTILEGIERSKQVHFKLQGRKLFVLK